MKIVGSPMASFGCPLGWLSQFCEERLCVQRSIIDMLNLVFIFVFYLSLLVGFIRKNNISGHNRRGWITLVLSACCSLTSISYLSAVLWDLIYENNRFSHLSWSVSLARALVWITLTVSLLAKKSKWGEYFVYFWWVVFFLLVSTLNIDVLIKKHRILVLDMVEWLLLFFGVMRNLSYLISQKKVSERLSEPLLVKESNRKESQLEQASFLSKLLFSWVNPLLSLGYSKPLVLQDIPCLATQDQSIVAQEKFSHAWDSLQREKTEGNLVFRAIARVYWKEMLFTGTCVFLRTICVVVSPLLLFAFVNHANREAENINKGLMLVGFLAFVKLVESFSHRHFYFESRRTGMRMRSSLMVAVYEKQLKLSNQGRQRHSTGEVVNYIAVDAYRMGEFPMWFHMGWSCGIQLFLAVGVLFGIVGVSVLPGLVPFLICAILNVPFVKMLHKCQSEFMISQDKRLRSMSEILNNMKIIKLQSWEEKFKKLVESYREIEFKWLSESLHNRVYGTVLYWMSPTLVSSVIFFGCAFLKSAPLDAGTIFTILAALRTMSEPVKMIPEALSVLIQVKVSFERINSFLLDDELNNVGVMRDLVLRDSDNSIKISNANFSWDPNSFTLTLQNINLKVRSGQKIAVCGPVGSGKSSLLYAILGEISRIAGNVDVLESIAYVSQASWIQSGTIQDNILFGKKMEKTKYEKAIKVCALDKDIDSFEHGDLTEIGERGLNMSGGQKQRIQLARAVYSDADLYLLDDPFSAVDAHTQATLFNDCVMDELQRKTVILVTHQVEFLSEVDNILVMKNGQITQSGSYNELLMAGMAFEQLVNAHKDSMTVVEPSINGNEREIQKGNTDEVEESNRSHLNKENSEAEICMLGLPGVQLTEAEEIETGNVGWQPLLDYVIISKGSLFLCLSVLTQSCFVAFQAAASYWLAFGIRIPNISSMMLISVYTLISTMSAFFVYLRSLFAVLLGLKASRAFFSGFTDSVFSAPMLFFDSTPIGRILTRASSDLSVLDFDVPFGIAYVVAAGIELIASIGIMASVTWQVLIIAIFAIIASKYVQGYYQPSARELMRINGTTKSPVMNYTAETSLGVATIRAFKMTDIFFKNYLKLVDTDASTFLYSNATMEWLILRTEALQNLTLFASAFLLVLLPQGYITPGLVGLSFSYALALTGTQVFLSRWYSSLCNYIISVERIKQYMHIPAEPPAILEDNRPPSSWPSKGRIEFHKLKVKYRPNAPLVLKGITCTFKEGTRIGIVGRTGSGKTTLITALFRLVEPHSGKILIDELDIRSIGLKDLRMKLSVIPQEPTLFKGSIRTNMDPLNLYSDDEIWKALEKCQLKATISSLPNLLDSSVSDEGENWSVGQRQLFCLGRVLLRRNKILVLDEATASIDSATDAILQRIIREEFANCTVITVAHRVPTVIDSDMVMVLSFGKLLEYDQPSNLMDTNSSFSKLVAEYWSSCRRNSVQELNDYHN